MKVRVKFQKYGPLRFLGHLDVMRYFQKVIRRAEIPVAFTSGYSPHMIMSFASPLGIGLTSEGEYFDMELTEPVASEEAVRRMNDVGTEGITVTGFRQISDEKKATGMAIVAAADYEVSVRIGSFPEQLPDLLDAFIHQTEILIVKQTKRSEKLTDIRPMIYHMEVCPADSDFIFYESSGDRIRMRLAAGSVENLKPDLVMSAFCRFAGICETDIAFHYHRTELYANAPTPDGGQQLVTLESLGTEIS